MGSRPSKAEAPAVLCVQVEEANNEETMRPASVKSSDGRLKSADRLSAQITGHTTIQNGTAKPGPSTPVSSVENTVLVAVGTGQSMPQTSDRETVQDEYKQNPGEDVEKEDTLQSSGKFSGPVPETLVQERIQDAKNRVDIIIENYSFETHRENTKVSNGLIALKNLYFKFKDLAPERATKSRREIGTYFVDSGFIPILCEIVVDYMTTGWMDAEGNLDKKIFQKLYNAFLMLFNYSDSTPAIAAAAATVSGFFEFIAQQLKKFYVKHSSGAEFTKIDETVTRNLLGFTHNASNDDVARKQQREVGFTAILIPFLGSQVEKFKMSSILSLANIVDEKESILLNTSVEAVQFLLKRLGRALKDDSRRNMGWSAKELAHGVGKLAANDTNKKMLVSEGALPLLLELSFVENEEEQLEAVEAIWALSFDDENKDLIIQEPGLISRLVELENSPDQEVRKVAQGVLWTLRYKLKDRAEFHQIGEKLIQARPEVTSEGSGSDVDGEFTPHIMISYQWDSQPLMLKIRDELKSRGYSTWMDVDYMGGSTLQAMAEAVENSAAVLICMSQRYKESPNCRAEAEYAFQRRVPMVPLMLENGYRPDGWLGIVLGSKLFFDFSGKYSFEIKIDGLVKELGTKGCRKEQPVKGTNQPVTHKPRDEADSGPVAIIPPVQSGIVSAAPPVGYKKAREVCNWGQKEVSVWLKEKDLQKPSLSSLSGKELLFLRGLKGEAPETFYSLLRKTLDLTSIEDLMKFVEALMDLL